MFGNLQDKLDSAFKLVKGTHKLTELNVAESVKEIRRALVAADVNYKIAKEFTDRVQKKALGTENILKSIHPGQLMTKIVSDELTDLMGGATVGINVKGEPGVVMVVGLQGSGKTTFVGKLAKLLKDQRQMKPLVVACDVYRPAAIDQLTVLAEQVGVPIYKEEGNKNAIQIAKNAVAHAKSIGCNVVIVDTAGRLAVDEAMMDEVTAVKDTIKPTEILFVVDSMTGQDAVNTAATFNEWLNYDGVVLTKLDGDTRGGAALSIKYTVGKPIKFASMGEKMDALDVFHPDRMASRILGMGDIVSLVEKAQLEFDEEEGKRLEAKMKKNTFDFNDFLGQMQMIKKMGDMKTLMGMIPGIGKAMKDVEIDDKALVRVEAIIYSMTPKERKNPDLINLSRKKRLAQGCGQNIEQINLFMKNFLMMKEMMHKMTNGQMPNMPGMPSGGQRGFRPNQLPMGKKR
jgi:signal recognition particle subunit SRP54